MISIKLNEEQTEYFLNKTDDLLILDHEDLPLAVIHCSVYMNHPEIDPRERIGTSHSMAQVREYLAFLDHELEALGRELSELEKEEFMRRTRIKYRKLKRRT